MNLRQKLILGFSIPAAMLFITGAWSSFQMRSVGQTVQQVLKENDASIRFAVQMNEALERMDSGILLGLHGEMGLFQEMYRTSHTDFSAALEKEKQNITLKGEKELVDSLEVLAGAYYDIIGKLDPSYTLEYYRMEISPRFTRIQHLISNLRLLNTTAMYDTAMGVADKAKRAALPGDIIMLAATIFTFLFIWLTHHYIVTPLQQTIRSINTWRSGGQFDLPTVETRDEIYALAQELKAISQTQLHGKY